MLTEMLVAYDTDGNVCDVLYTAVRRRRDGTKILVDFAAMEMNREPFDNRENPATGVWHHEHAVGSKVWPERLSLRSRDWRVEKEGPAGATRLTALVHKTSGHRRERAAIEQAISDRLTEATADAGGELRLTMDQYLELLADIVGLPTEPLMLTETGETAQRPERREVITLEVSGDAQSSR